MRAPSSSSARPRATGANGAGPARSARSGEGKGGGGFLPLSLGIARGPARAITVPSLSTPPDPERLAVLERDRYRCRFCGFTSRKYQDVIAAPDPAAAKAEQVTACLFCSQCFALDRAGAMRSGALVWLPEIGQAALHHIVRAIFLARINAGPVAEAARAAHDALLARREAARLRLGTDDPAALGNVLRDFMDDAQYARRMERLDGLRLLPLDRRVIREGDMEFNQFPQIVAYWRSKDGPFAGKPPAGWLDLFDQATAAAGGGRA